MKTKLTLTILLSLVFSLLSSQVPQGFNYQAIARDLSGNPIANTSLPVRITIQADSSGTIIIWQELHSGVTSNSFGLINLVIGKGARQATSTVATFSVIDWSVTPKFIKTEINYGGWITMGVTRFWSVPYALRTKDSDQWLTNGANIYRSSGNVGIGTVSPTNRLQIGDNLTIGSPVPSPNSISIGSDYGSNAVGTNFKLKLYDTPTLSNTFGLGVSLSLLEIVSGNGGSIGFFTNGANERMRITSSGNVGIGTTNPINLFEVKVAANQHLGVRQANSFLSLGTYNDVGTSYVRLDIDALTLNLNAYSGGNVGIGTATPNAKLQVNGDIYLPYNSGNSVLSFSMGGGNTMYLKPEANLLRIQSDHTGNPTIMSLDKTGNVGVGAKLSSTGMEIGGPAPDATNGQATLYLHHHGNIAHQLRYSYGILYFEAAGNGYGSTATPTLQVNGPLYAAMLGGKVGIGTASSASKVAIQPEASWADDVPLFEVKNKSGIAVLAVYNNGVRILVDHTINKAVKGGFAVGGYDLTKAGKTVDFMTISPDSIRFNINNDNVKAVKGGFAVGGFDATKGVINQDFMYITPQTSNNGQYNTFLGYKSGNSNGASGITNTFIGYQTGYLNIYGYSNVFVGYNAGYSNIGNTLHNTGYNNVYIGTLAGEKNNGTNNVFIGDDAGKALTGGVKNVIIGSSAGLQTTGNNNTYIGSNAGRYETGSDNVCIGYGAGYGSGESGYLAIGNRTNAGLITGSFSSSKLYLWAQVGINTSSVGTYQLYVAGSAYSTGGWSGSDIRWKKNISEIDNSLNQILQLKPVNYEWRKDEFPKQGFDEGKQIGLIAQDVEKTFPELVRTDESGYKAVSYEKLSVILLEGIKEQQKQIESQQDQINELKKIITDMQDKIASSR
jgi:trimeric autotransporter adhesin